MSRTVLAAGGTLLASVAFFNHRADTVDVTGSSSCMFGVTTYDMSGKRVAPINQICTADYRVVPVAPGDSLTLSMQWSATNGVAAYPPGPTPLAPGAYYLEPSLTADTSTITGRSLVINVQ